MSNENGPMSSENQIPMHVHTSRRFGQILQLTADAVGVIATSTNHSAVVQNLLEKVHMAGSQCDLNRAMYCEAVGRYAHNKVWYEDLYNDYLMVIRERDHLQDILTQKEEQLAQRESELNDIKRTLKYLRRSWDGMNRNYLLRDWRCQRLSARLQEFDPTFSAPTLLEDLIEGPIFDNVYPAESDSESEDPYQNAHTPTSTRAETSESDDYVPPRKIFKEEHA